MIFCPFKFWAMEMTVKSFPRPFLSLSSSYLLGSESQNHGTADIGRELCSSCCSIPLFKQSQEPASTPGTYKCIPSGHMELCASFLKYYLISSSPTKNKSSLLQNFPSSPGPWLWRGKKKFWYGRIEGILIKLTNNTQLSMLVYTLKERDDIQNDLDRLEEKAVQMP